MTKEEKKAIIEILDGLKRFHEKEKEQNMAGKCRPSLRAKTLENVNHSNLSQTNKDCIAEVFKRYEALEAEIERLQTEIDNADEGKLRHTKGAYREEVFNELKNKYTKEGVGE